ncbi:MAG: arginine deiminase-related protein [Candidatus Aquilonibacter sp.]|jgi:N-dimethylarginine dimethylaminohydrolase
MTRFLMCAPTHFRVAYDINPWMTRNVGGATAQASRQWERLVALLLDEGRASIELIEPQAGLPDIVFTANAALISERLAIVSSFRYPERRPEEQRYRERLHSLGYATTALNGAFFEGAGDALFDRRLALIYFGYGWRSDHAAAPQLERLCATRVLPLRLVDPRFYHLDTALCPLASGHVIAYLPAFAPKSQALLRMTLGSEYLIEVSEDDALGFACNAVEAGDAIVLHSASNALRHRLGSAGYRVFETDLSDFHKAGGSSKCLALKLEDGPVRRAAVVRGMQALG